MLSFFCQDCMVLVAHKKKFRILQLEFNFDIVIMSDLIHLGYQYPKKCSAEEFLQLRGIVNRKDVMYPTMESIVMEKATSDFEPVPHNEYETSLQDQVQ